MRGSGAAEGAPWTPRLPRGFRRAGRPHGGTQAASNWRRERRVQRWKGLQGGSAVKNPPATQETGFSPRVGKTPWRGKRQLTPVFLPWKPHRQRSLAGYSQRGRKELDMTE